MAEAMPEKVRALDQQLTEVLTEMKASYPYYNPDGTAVLPHKEKVGKVVSHKLQRQRAEFRFEEKGAKMVSADLIYTLNGGERYEEWYRIPAEVHGVDKVVATLPEGTTHFYLNVIDEHRFLVSYPKVAKAIKKSFVASALSVATGKVLQPLKKEVAKVPGKKPDLNVPFDRWDTDKSGTLSLKEYLTGQTGEKLEERFNRFDRDSDGKVTRDEFVHRGK